MNIRHEKGKLFIEIEGSNQVGETTKIKKEISLEEAQDFYLEIAETLYQCRKFMVMSKKIQI